MYGIGVAGNSIGMLAACVANWPAVEAALLVGKALMARSLRGRILCCETCEKREQFGSTDKPAGKALLCRTPGRRW